MRNQAMLDQLTALAPGLEKQQELQTGAARFRSFRAHFRVSELKRRYAIAQLDENAASYSEAVASLQSAISMAQNWETIISNIEAVLSAVEGAISKAEDALNG